MTDPNQQMQTIDPPKQGEDLTKWIERLMSPERPWLLAHADDGIVWGKLCPERRLITSHDLLSSISPRLQLLTLQQAYIFGEDGGEIRLWRVAGGWEARQILDSEDVIEEDLVLWGTQVVERFPQGFTHIREKRQQGMDHAVPIEVTDGDLAQRRLRLLVRHYVGYDPATGEAQITLSRLVKIHKLPGEDDETS
jgi:CRISPR-associated protein (TIGR03984 family)